MFRDVNAIPNANRVTKWWQDHCANGAKDPQCEHVVLTSLPISLICVARYS
jgi:hypothetical protein